MTTTLRIFFLFLAVCINLCAADTPSVWYTSKGDKEVTINVELYLSTTCKYCHKADAFFTELQANTPWLHIQRYVINEDKNALTRFNQLLSEQNMYDFSVPSVFFCNSRWIGFASNQTTGKDLLRGLTYCKNEIEKKGTLSPVTVNVLKRWAHANLFDSSMIEKPSAAKYIGTIALMDAFNPCAFFCLAGFFALLFLQEERKNQFMAGILFILTVGGVHYFQQAHASTFFGLFPLLRVPAALTGLFTFYLAGQYYRKRSSAHLFFLLTFLLAFMIQSYQQTCIMNWSYIFGQWLYNQQLNNAQLIAYQLAYQGIYLLFLFITLVFYILLIRMEFLAKFRNQLKTIGLLYIMAIGLMLIIYPLALANLVLSLITVLVLFVCGWILSRFRGQ
ncbi:hypothetical protein Lmor_2823 [Legionella moravica]|uniref:Thioredoxin domain-containing protein n=1 Tax=Legionella moravica TaxID=39962 RepID=A0A378JZL4_9GAMM|nr:hypothetical protein [Legionella moravica]KTD30716.1 hypothetical protein Lmor_2823 [Legionella moravica]STX63460.1 Uncharacterised protein [Legionella moravica]